MSEQRTIKWYLENQAGLTPEPRMWIDEAEAAIKEIVRGWIPSEEKIRHIIHKIAEEHFAPITIGFKLDVAQAIRQAMIEKVGGG